MSSFLKVQVTLLLIYSSISPAIGISNIFKSFPIFGWAVDNNNGTFSEQLTNTTNQSDDRETCIPPLLLNGIIDPSKREYKAKDVIRVTCKDGFELEDQSSSVLYCSPPGLWQVFTFDNDGSIPLPRCTAIERCPPLPPLIQGSMQVQEARSNGQAKKTSPTMVTYKCWAGYRLEPADSSSRYCNGGQWSGENPKCVRASCTRPPSITRGYFTSRGIVNHVYQPGSTAYYHCDSGYQLNGPSVLTCSDAEWTPKEILPSCSLARQSTNGSASWPTAMIRGCALPPPIANGQFEILPMKQQQQQQQQQQQKSVNSTWPTGVVPIYSSAVYSCRPGFTMRGSSLISCTAHGWWQPPYNTPRCVPDGPDPGTNSIQRPVNANGGARRGVTDGNGKLMIHPWMLDAEDDGAEYEHDDDGQIERWTPVVSLSMAFGVVFVLGLVWIASRCNSLYRIPLSPSSASSASSGSLAERGGGGGSCGRSVSRCLVGHHQRPSAAWWSRLVPSRASRSPCAAATSASDDDDDQARTSGAGRICGTYLNIHHQASPSNRSAGAAAPDDADRLALIGCSADQQQMTLPSYEEAMRTSSTIHHHNHHHVNRYVWPMAPPPYDAVVSSSSSASSNFEPAASTAAAAAAAAAIAAAAPAIENPPTVIHHEEPAASSSASRGSRPVDERIVEISAAEPSVRQAIVCIDHRSDDSGAAGADDDASADSRENLVP